MHSSPYRAQFNSSSQSQNPSQPPSQQFHKYQKSSTSFYVFQPRPPVPPIYQATEFDGKRLRKAIARKTVDYNSSVTKMLESRIWQRDYRDSYALHPDIGYYTEVWHLLSIHSIFQTLLMCSIELDTNYHVFKNCFPNKSLFQSVIDYILSWILNNFLLKLNNYFNKWTDGSANVYVKQSKQLHNH